MNLHWKFICGIFLVVAALNVSLYIAAERSLLEVMAHLEDEKVEHLLESGYSVLLRRIGQLEKVADDYAAWDATYEFMVDRDPEYIESKLDLGTYGNFEINLLLILSNTGEVVYSGYFDLEEEEMVPPPDQLIPDIVNDQRLWSFAHPTDFRAGIIMLAGRNYLIAMQPVTTSSEDGPVRGALLVARMIDSEIMDELRDDGNHGYSVGIIDEQSGSGLKENPGEKHLTVETVDDEYLQGSLVINDMFGKPIMKLSVLALRDIYLHGLKILDEFMRGNLLICMFFAVVIYLAISRNIKSIEEKRSSEARYERLSQEFKTILDGIPNPLVLVSPQMMILWANRAGAEQLPGVTQSEHGKFIADVPYISYFDADKCPVRRCLATGVISENTAQVEDGRILSSKAFPIMEPDREIVAAVIRITTDVTEENRLRKETEQASRLASLGELSAGIAHEINNPTGMLLMNLALLTDVYQDIEPYLVELNEKQENLFLAGIPFSRLQEKLPYLLREMMEGGRRIRRIVEDLKGFARKDLKDEVASVDMNGVVQAAIRLVEYQLKKATADFKTIYDETLPRAHGDFRRLEQVVINLLVNATQALTDRSQAISVETLFDQESQMVSVVILDEGRGIRASDLDKITDPFFTTRRNEGGTGIGLSLSARIVKEHGGKIHFESHVGQGTIVQVLLPISPEEAA